MYTHFRVGVLVGLLGLALGGLPGCGGDAGDSGPVTLQVCVWKANNPAAWDYAVRRFHETHPGVRIALEIGPNSSTQLHDLITQKLRNRDASLDAFLMDVVWPPEFAAAGWALQLDDRLPPEERAAFFPGTLAAVTYAGGLYGVPFNTDGGLLYYREDLLAQHALQPPRTWLDLIEQVEIIRGDVRPIAGYCGQFKQYEGLVCNMLEFVRSAGGSLTAPAGADAIAAVAFVRDWIIGSAAPRGVLTYEEQESLDLFKSGGAVFLRSWPYAWPILHDPEQSSVVGRVGITRLPAFKEGLSTAALGGWSFGIHSRSRHPAEAWSFVAFMTGPEMQRHFAQSAGKAPARRALYADEQVLAANPHFAHLAAVFETATPRPSSPIYPRISHILQRYFHAAIADPESDIASLARDAEARITAEARKISSGP